MKCQNCRRKFRPVDRDRQDREERYYRAAFGTDLEVIRCDDCHDVHAESAFERQCQDFHEGAGVMHGFNQTERR